MYILNGILYRNDPALPIQSPHFQYGTGFFETLLYHKGKILFYEDHINRIKKTCEDFSIMLDYDQLSQETIIKLTAGLHYDTPELRIKILYAPLLSEDQDTWDIIISAMPYARKDSPLTASLHRAVYNSSFNRYKSVNYDYKRHMKKIYERQDGSDEVLLCLDRKHILEGSYTNILARRGREIFHVNESNPYLPGTAQARILEYLPRAGYRITSLSRGFTLRFLKKTDEVLLTNSLMIARRLTRIISEGRIHTLGPDSTLSEELLSSFLT